MAWKGKTPLSFSLHKWECVGGLFLKYQFTGFLIQRTQVFLLWHSGRRLKIVAHDCHWLDVLLWLLPLPSAVQEQTALFFAKEGDCFKHSNGGSGSDSEKNRKGKEIFTFTAHDSYGETHRIWVPQFHLKLLDVSFSNPHMFYSIMAFLQQCYFQEHS